MDPTACLNRIMELELELSQLNLTVGEIRKTDTYEEWEGCWLNLINWLLIGGFAPTLSSLKPAGLVKRRIHSDHLSKFKMVTRMDLLSPRFNVTNCVSIFPVDMNNDSGDGPYVLNVYGPKGKLVKSFDLPME